MAQDAPGPEDLVDLKSSKVQLEVGLIYLKRKRAELERQIERQRGASPTGARSPAEPDAAARLARWQAELASVAAEVASRESTIRELAAAIERGERQAHDEDLAELLVANDRLAEELAALRAEALRTLRSLADPLRRFQEVADRKSRLVKRIKAGSGRDLSYPNHLSCALFPQDEYDDALRFVVEALRRQRVVS